MRHWINKCEISTKKRSQVITRRSYSEEGHVVLAYHVMMMNERLQYKSTTIRDRRTYGQTGSHACSTGDALFCVRQKETSASTIKGHIQTARGTVRQRALSEYAPLRVELARRLERSNGFCPPCIGNRATPCRCKSRVVMVRNCVVNLVGEDLAVSNSHVYSTQPCTSIEAAALKCVQH